jgi:hypothetical protein
MPSYQANPDTRKVSTAPAQPAMSTACDYTNKPVFLLLCRGAYTTAPGSGRAAHPERRAARAGEAHRHVRQARRSPGRQLAGGQRHHAAALPGLVAVRAAGAAAPRALAALLRRRQKHRRHARRHRRAHRPAAQQAHVNVVHIRHKDGKRKPQAAHRQTCQGFARVIAQGRARARSPAARSPPCAGRYRPRPSRAPVARRRPGSAAAAPACP